MADAFQKQLDTDEAAALNFEERLGLLIDTEWTAREQRKLQRRLQTAKLRYPASLEAVDFTRARQLNCQQVLTLGTCAWIAERHNLIITGPCGIGKSFLCCALVRMRSLPLQQLVNVALAVPDHHHPRPGTRPPQRPALIEPPEPAPALLLPFHRRFGFRPRPRLQPAHPQRPPSLGKRHRRMHEQTPCAALTLPKRSQPAALSRRPV